MAVVKKYLSSKMPRGVAIYLFVVTQYSLSLMYIEAQSIERDLVEAYMWLDLAVKQDHRGAMKTRGLISKQLSPSEINEAEKRSSNWKPTIQ